MAKQAKTEKSRDDRVIRLQSKQNPRRKGTDAHEHFERMKGGPTISEYLAKFKGDEAKKTARAWLQNTVRDGHAVLLG